MSRFGIIVSCLTLMLFGIATFAQTDPAGGIRPFSTQAGGPYDSVDLSTGSITLLIPIRTKVGKVPFSLSLVDNSHAFVRALSPTSNGWYVSTQVAPRSFSANMTATIGYQTTSYQCYGSQLEHVLSNFTVTDATGAVHPSSLSVQWGYCGSTTGTAMTTDNSGYTINVTSANPLTYTVYDRSGNAVNTATAGGVTTTTVTDPDGVTLSSSQNTSALLTTYTDTLATTALTSTLGEWNGNPDTHTYTDINGNSQTVQVNYTVYPLKTNFGCAGIGELDWTALTNYFPTSIVMPDGGKFGITYEKTPGNTSEITGRIETISYPSGGSVTYKYSGGNNGINCTSGVVPTLTRTVNDNNGNVNKWTYVNSNNSTTGTFTVTITDPSNNYTVQTFSGGFQTEAQVYQGTIAPANLLGTTVTCYNGNFANCPSLTSAPTTVTQTDVFTYPTGSSSASLVETKFNASGTIAEVKKYDFGAAATLPPTAAPGSSPLLDTTITYDGQNGVSCGMLTASYMYDRPCAITASSGGTTVSQTQYSYSGTGHPTQTSKMVSSSFNLTSWASYNGNGTIASFTDVNRVVTNYYYNGTGGCNSLLATSESVTFYSQTLSTSQQWNCNGGVPTLAKDANKQPTAYGYVNPSGVADPYWRVLSTTDPLGNVTWNAYVPATSSAFATQERYLNFNPSSSPTSTVDILGTVDGLGRMLKSQTRTAPGTTTFDNTIQYAYGWNTTGSVTGPFTTQTIPGGTAVTTTQLDALGRAASVIDGGGGTLGITYAKNDVLRTVGPPPTTENAKSRQLEYDGVGRTTSVCEILSSGGSSCGQNTSASGYKTSYTYTTLSAGSSQFKVVQGSQNRTFFLTASAVSSPKPIPSRAQPRTLTIRIPRALVADGPVNMAT